MQTFAIRGHKTTKTAHVAWVIDGKVESTPICSTHARGEVRMGRSDLGTVEGHEGVVADAERLATEHGHTMCAECLGYSTEILADHAEHRAQIVAEGAAAGRTIRHTVTLVVDEVVPETATLYSIKGARESFEHRLADLMRDYPGVQITSEFVEA